LQIAHKGKRLFGALRAGDTLVVRWVDRLGRNHADVCDTIREFMRRGVVIKTVINGMTFDVATKDAMQQAVCDALIAFMAATAQTLAEATKEAQRAGIENAKAAAEKRYLGRKPSCTRAQYQSVIELLAHGWQRHRQTNGFVAAGDLPDKKSARGFRGGVDSVGIVSGRMG
jgi:putative DNA-invertase from lambdoid prophage Rac